MARVEFAHLASILFVDSDEFLFCPAAYPYHNSTVAGNRSSSSSGSGEGGDPVVSQLSLQKKLLDRYRAQGTQELRLVRKVYSAKCTHPYSLSSARAPVGMYSAVHKSCIDDRI
jgi:hypothetical protein